MADYSMPFTDHYAWDGRLLDEPDYPDEPQLRRHCACGAFLPKNPREISRAIPTKVDYIYDNEGMASVIVLEAEEEKDAVWTCTKCGKEYDTSEMYQ